MRCQIIIAIIFVLVEPMKLLECPSPYLPVGSGCYYITLQTGITWYQAFFNCALDLPTGYLAEVESEEEFNDITSLIRATDPNSVYSYWIGAADLQQEGEYRWMTSGEPVNYTSWASGEPNNYDGNEDCLVLAVKEVTYEWNDGECELPMSINQPTKGICEADPMLKGYSI